MISSELKKLFLHLKKEYKSLKGVKLSIERTDPKEIGAAFFEKQTITFFKCNFPYGMMHCKILLLHEVRHALQENENLYSAKDWEGYETRFKDYYKIEKDADTWAMEKFYELFIENEPSKRKKTIYTKFLKHFKETQTQKSFYKQFWDCINKHYEDI